jgi:hypothetical protein
MNPEPRRGDIERRAEPEYMSPFQGFDCQRCFYQGLRPWLHDLAPPGPDSICIIPAEGREPE